MRYFFTLVTIILGWVVIVVLMNQVEASQHFTLYVLGVVNTLVLFTIGFRKQ